MRGHFLRAAAGRVRFSAATLAWLAAVEAADGAALEPAVYNAMGTFADYRIPLGGACCLMAGARTLAGALVPMVGPAPTNVNFVSGDYSRAAGLRGDGASKYINTNVNNNASGQDNAHAAVYVSTVPTSTSGRFPVFIGAGSSVAGSTTLERSQNNGAYIRRLKSSGGDSGGTVVSGFLGMSRAASASYTYRGNALSTTINTASSGNLSESMCVFVALSSGSPLAITYSNAVISYYSVGTNVNMVPMETAIVTCISALAAAGI